MLVNNYLFSSEEEFTSNCLLEMENMEAVI